jgi:hypothetical protein
VPLTIRLSPELEELLVARAKVAGQSKSEYARALLAEALEGPVAKATKSKKGKAECRHPIGMRIAGVCMMCMERP